MQVWEAGHLGTKLLAHLQCRPEDWPDEVAKTASKKLDIVLIKIKPAPCSQVRKAKRNGRRGGKQAPGLLLLAEKAHSRQAPLLQQDEQADF